MTDFHKGDVVYAPEVGSVTEISKIELIQGVDGSLRVVGYDTEFGLLRSEQMQLVKGGYDRSLVEEYLKKRTNGGSHS